MDLIHHIPYESVRPLVNEIVRNLQPGSCIVIKDVERRPWYKMAFTWLLDKFMDFRAPVRYWSQEEMLEMLRGCGLRVYRHAMLDFLPYPHVIYVGWKDTDAPQPRSQ